MILDLYNKCQEDTCYQEYCIPVLLTSPIENSKTIWLPEVVLLHLDRQYFEAMNCGKWAKEQFGFTLDEQTESIEGFELFISRWLQNKLIKNLNTREQVFALNTSMRFGKNIYKYTFKDIELINDFGSDDLVRNVVQMISKQSGVRLDQFKKIRRTTEWTVDKLMEVDFEFDVELEFLHRFKNLRPIIGWYKGALYHTVYGEVFVVVKTEDSWIVKFENGNTITCPLNMTHMRYCQTKNEFIFSK